MYSLPSTSFDSNWPLVLPLLPEPVGLDSVLVELLFDGSTPGSGVAGVGLEIATSLLVLKLLWLVTNPIPPTKTKKPAAS